MSGTVAAFKPKAHAVFDLEMSCRRALAVGRLAQLHLDLCDSAVEEARNTPPHVWGNLDARSDKTRLHRIADGRNPHQLIKTLFGEPLVYEVPWPTLFDLWYSGDLDRQVQQMLPLMTETNRQSVLKERPWKSV